MRSMLILCALLIGCATDGAPSATLPRAQGQQLTNNAAEAELRYVGRNVGLALVCTALPARQALDMSQTAVSVILRQTPTFEEARAYSILKEESFRAILRRVNAAECRNSSQALMNIVRMYGPIQPGVSERANTAQRIGQAEEMPTSVSLAWALTNRNAPSPVMTMQQVDFVSRFAAMSVGCGIAQTDVARNMLTAMLEKLRRRWGPTDWPAVLRASETAYEKVNQNDYSSNAPSCEDVRFMSRIARSWIDRPTPVEGGRKAPG